MGAEKIILLFLIAFVAVEGLKKDERYLEEFSTLVKNCKNRLAGAENQLKDEYHSVIAFAQGEQRKAFESINNIHEEKMKHINDIKNLANDMEIEYYESDDDLENVTMLANNAKLEIMECVGDLLERLETLFEEMLAATNASSERITQLIFDFENCESDECRMNTVVGIINEMFEINNICRELVADAVRIFKESIPEIVKCITSSTSNYEMEAKFVFRNALSNINDEILDQ